MQIQSEMEQQIAAIAAKGGDDDMIREYKTIRGDQRPPDGGAQGAGRHL